VSQPATRQGGGPKRTTDPLSLRRHFFTGVLVVVPAAVSAWVLYRLFSWVDGLLWDEIRFGWVRPEGIPGVGIVAVLLAVFLIGLLVNNYIGRRFYRIYDRLLSRIPLFNKIYTVLKQLGEAVLSSEKTVFRSVGMIQYPRKGIWSLVFLTDQPSEEMMSVAGERLRSVFLPTTPNPTSGFFLMLPESEIHPLAVSVEDGLKMVISGGVVVPAPPVPRVAPPAGVRAGRTRWWSSGAHDETAAAAPKPDEPA